MRNPMCITSGSHLFIPLDLGFPVFLAFIALGGRPGGNGRSCDLGDVPAYSESPRSPGARGRGGDQAMGRVGEPRFWINNAVPRLRFALLRGACGGYRVQTTCERFRFVVD